MSQSRRLSLAYYAGESHPAYLAAKQFAANVALRTHGQLEIDIIHTGVLSQLAEQLQHVVDGKVDMAIPPHDRFSSFSRKFACVGLPFVFDDYDHADRVLDNAFMDWAVPDLAGIGLSFLGNWELGFRHVSNSLHPILVPQDMQGLKIRVPPILQIRAAIQAMGAEALPIEYIHLTQSLRQGLVDGEENPISVIHALKLYDTQKYLSLLGYNYSAMVHVINKACFDSLSAEQRQILCEESKLAGLLARDLMRSHEMQQIAELEFFGVRVDRPDLAPFKLAVKPAYKILRASFGADVINPFLKMVEKARC
ncbi:MAG: TRAP transporter substrate-binding protein [Formivibrio sp.]|nr:TRAP transporter substrate-binding protein [Formivibrio sp.]